MKPMKSEAPSSHPLGDTLGRTSPDRVRSAMATGTVLDSARQPTVRGVSSAKRSRATSQTTRHVCGGSTRACGFSQQAPGAGVVKVIGRYVDKCNVVIGHGSCRDAGILYRDLAPAVLGYLRGQGVPDPEDLLGEVFLQVARDLRAVRGDQVAVRRWVFTLARNRVIDDARRRSRRPVTTGGAVPERAGPDREEPLDPSLLSAIDRLTPDQREVVLLRFVADLPIEAVARITGRTAGAVKALQHRALVQLAGTVSYEARPTL